MFTDNVTPRARHWAVPFMAFGIAIVLMWRVAPSDVWKMVLGVIGAGFFFWSLMNFIYHSAYTVSNIKNDARRLDYMLSENYKAELMTKMNESQLRAFRAGHHLVGVYPSADGITIDKLADEEVYLYFAWYVLTNSTSTNVYPINNFQPGTYHFDMIGDHAVDDYQQARNFHTWLVRYGYAEWGRGNLSASWKRPFNPDEVLRRLQMDRNTYRQTSEE